jgi:hypothetical protein
VLAGAVWKLRTARDDYAFEEYSSVKKRKKKRIAGRLDLEFSVSKQRFIAEAKQCWLRSPKNERFVERIIDAIKRAGQDVPGFKPYGMRRLAVVFGVPSFKQSNLAELQDHIDRFIKDAVQIDAHAVAWAFPKLRRTPIWEDFIYPGVVLWVKEIKQ